MRRLVAAVLAASAILGAAVAPTTAMTGNYVPDTIHPFVGLVVFYDASGEFSHRCSGSLVSPTLFVTAGHCADGVTAARIYFERDAGAHYDPALGHDPVSGYPDTGGVTGAAYDFGFADFAGFPDTKDAGVVILDASIFSSKYAAQMTSFGTLAPAGFLDEHAVKQGGNTAWFTMSGYGLSDQKPVVVSYRSRLMATSRLVNTGSHLTDGFNLQTTANPGDGKGGTCSGDSGGPFFWQDTDIIVSVNSFGLSAICAGVDFSYRLDRQPVLDWIVGPHP